MAAAVYVVAALEALQRRHRRRPGGQAAQGAYRPCRRRDDRDSGRRRHGDPRLPFLLAAPAHPRHVRRAVTRQRLASLAAGLNITVTGNVGSTVGPLTMGIDWMHGTELSQAIPPAYTEHIGRQLLEHLTAAAA
jgi:hypothetical protein